MATGQHSESELNAAAGGPGHPGAEADPFGRLVRAGLPPEFLEHLRRAYPDGLLPFQRRVAAETRLLEGGSLVLLAPTSAGKTLLAELACWRHLGAGRRAIYLVPTRALAEEVHRRLARAGEALGRRVLVSTREHAEHDAFVAAGAYDILVVIYEKLRALLVQHRHLLRGVGLLVADELQSLGEPGRGEEIDLLLTWIRRRAPGVQMLAISSVLSRSDELGAWLEAEVDLDRERPLALREGVFDLEEGVYVYREAEGGEPRRERLIEPAGAEGGGLSEEPDEFCRDGTLGLVRRLAVDRGEQVLLFVPQRRMAQTWAAALAAQLAEEGAEEEAPPGGRAALRALDRAEYSLLRHALAECLQAGVAFHHAEMPGQLRRLVEEAYRAGEVRVLVATSTLSQGVNLTGRYVVSVPAQVATGPGGRAEMARLTRERFRNQGGRAARLGLAAAGEVGRSILVASGRGQARQLWLELVEGRLPRLESPLPRARMEKVVLMLLAGEGSAAPADLAGLLGATLGAAQAWSAPGEPARVVEAALDRLREGALVREAGEGRFEPTGVGRVVATSGVQLATAAALRAWLEGMPPGELPSELEAIFVAAATPDARLQPFRLSFSERSRLNYIVLLEERLRDEAGFAHGAGPPERLTPLLARAGGFGHEDFASAKKALAVADWIGPEATRRLEERYGLFAGAFQNAGHDLQWILEMAAALAETLALPAELTDRLRRLALRLPLGLEERAAGLAPLQRVSLTRGEAGLLVREGYDTLETLASTAPGALAAFLPAERAAEIQALALTIIRARHAAGALRVSAAAPEPAEAGAEPAAPYRAAPPAAREPTLRLDPELPRLAWMRGRQVQLTPLAYRLLLYLARRRGRCVSYEELSAALWEERPRVALDQIHQHKKLILREARQTLGVGQAREIIQTVRRCGLRLALPQEELMIA